MSRAGFRRYGAAAGFLVVAVGVMIFAFWPFNRAAREQSLRSKQVSETLETQIELIESLPARRTDLERLRTSLESFRSELAGVGEVDQVMSGLRGRAEERGLQMWMLNPSVPVLIRFDADLDSLARLDLAVLPVTFECRGPFAQVADFLAVTESRADFCRWASLAVTADPPVSQVSARAEIRLFLLPVAGKTEFGS